ncbi:MAG: cell wall hydrolase [Sphingobium sp.]
MAPDAPGDAPHWGAMLLWLGLLAGLPAFIAWHQGGSVPAGRVASYTAAAAYPHTASPSGRTVPPLPAVDPVENHGLDREQARQVNIAIPFSPLPNPAARPFVFAGPGDDRDRAVDCLAAAQLYEAGDDPVGERAVAQVVLNRVRHPAFPGTVCGVVFQGQERSTGCQFTFTCDGALARTPSASAWNRARAIAREALAGAVFAPVGHATHYHTDWVVPYWSGSLDKVTAVGTHLFFRWRGWWGTPPAFRRHGEGQEPVIGRIARLSTAHDGAAGEEKGAAAIPLDTLAARPAQPIGAESIGRRFGGARLVAAAPGPRASFLVELGQVTPPDDWPGLADSLCAGRRECRVMGWRAGMTPAALPLSAPQLETMAFAYIHNAATGLQRSLWNCDMIPRADKAQCMRRRVPAIAAPASASTASPSPPGIVTLGGVRRKDQRIETVKIRPVAPPVSGP